ncbi:MAG: hypothetical protein J0I09_12380 [Sphingobacteriia bacterium]|nr:hypothetical protein [Sphingobacteriia bacterium]
MKIVQHNNKSRSTKLLMLAFLILFMGVGIPMAYAGPDGPSEIDAPVDGGLSLLIASGVGYGIKRMRKNKNSTQFTKNKNGY